LDEDTRYHDLGTDIRQQGYVRRHKRADGRRLRISNRGRHQS
jgi:hypothetical protein